MRPSKYHLIIIGTGLGAVLSFSCAAPKKPVFLPALQQSRQYYAAGEYKKAIDSYNALYGQFPAEKHVRGEYFLTLEVIKDRGDSALASKDYAVAEKTYSVLLLNFAKFRSFERSLSFGPEELNRRLRECHIGRAEEQTGQHLRAGDYEKALETYKGMPQAERQDARAATGFARAMEEIKRRADEAAARQDYTEAGKVYALLARNHATVLELKQPLSFSREFLEKSLIKCRTELTRAGLEQYRKGNLAEAISLWQGLLRFDPNNIEIKKAVETASEQQKKLLKK
jgi:tetratricopeptide (TPR) repeat protein